MNEEILNKVFTCDKCSKTIPSDQWVNFFYEENLTLCEECRIEKFNKRIGV